MRGVLRLFPLTLALSRRERGKQCALFSGRISKMKSCRKDAKYAEKY